MSPSSHWWLTALGWTIFTAACTYIWMSAAKSLHDRIQAALAEAPSTPRTLHSPSALISHVLSAVNQSRHPKNDCLIFKDHLNRPVRIKKCKHVFCQTCIRSTLGQIEHCPLCQQQLFQQQDVRPREHLRTVRAIRAQHQDSLLWDLGAHFVCVILCFLKASTEYGWGPPHQYFEKLLLGGAFLGACQAVAIIHTAATAENDVLGRCVMAVLSLLVGVFICEGGAQTTHSVRLAILFGVYIPRGLILIRAELEEGVRAILEGLNGIWH